uniref:Nonstructural protein n=1 Tax=Dulem virus 156 TaxID=3145633 RepID=A0AAU8B282_9VIRU
MIYGVYSIFDSASGVFTSPTVDLSDESSIRSFSQACSNSGSLMNFKPSDFVLYRLGSFNVETGSIDSFSPPNKLCSADSFMKEVVNVEDR